MLTGRAWWGLRPFVRVGFAGGTALVGGWRFARRKGWGESLEKVWGVKVVEDAIFRSDCGYVFVWKGGGGSFLWPQMFGEPSFFVYFFLLSPWYGVLFVFGNGGSSTRRG